MSSIDETWLLVNEAGNVLQTNELDRAFHTDHDTPLRVIEYRRFKKALAQIQALKAEVKFITDSYAELSLLHKKIRVEVNSASDYMGASIL